MTGRQDVRSRIIHADGRCTDLAGIVDPATYAELENSSSPRLSPTLWCGSCASGIYIRHGAVQRDVLFGAHHRAGNCTDPLLIRKATLSDEHKRQAEYHAKAAERAGHAADFEVVTTGHTRVDVVIDNAIGIEVQRSKLTKAAAVDRTARSVAAGLESVTWFTDRDTSPQWNGHVPGYRTTLQGWKELPPLGTAGAAGLWLIEAARCGTYAPCRHRRGGCGKFIPWPGAWAGLYVDDVVAGLASGLIRPVRFQDHVRLMHADSIALHEELTGTPLTYQASTPKGRLLLPAGRQECERVTLIYQPDALPPAVRTRLEAETVRVQQQRAEQERQEREERERQAAQERERQERQAAYQRMLDERRERERHEATMRQLRERRTLLERQAEEERELAAYGMTCEVPIGLARCGQPARLYPNSDHFPIARCRVHEPHHLTLDRRGRVVIGAPLDPIPAHLRDRTA